VCFASERVSRAAAVRNYSNWSRKIGRGLLACRKSHVRSIDQSRSANQRGQVYHQSINVFQTSAENATLLDLTPLVCKRTPTGRINTAQERLPHAARDDVKAAVLVGRGNGGAGTGHAASMPRKAALVCQPNTSVLARIGLPKGTQDRRRRLGWQLAARPGAASGLSIALLRRHKARSGRLACICDRAKAGDGRLDDPRCAD
jgi:hypothetical protein